MLLMMKQALSSSARLSKTVAPNHLPGGPKRTADAAQNLPEFPEYGQEILQAPWTEAEESFINSFN